MKKITNYLILITIPLLMSYLCWDIIYVPFTNTHEIISPLTVAKINPFGQVIKFYLSPVLAFFLVVLFYLLVKKEKFEDIFSRCQKDFLKQSAFNTKENIKIYYFFIILIFLSNLTYLTGFRFVPLREIDLLHHGENLTSAYNYLLSGKMWLSSYVNHGAGKDIFIAYLPWKIFNVVNVGSYEFGKIILFKILLPYTLYIYLIQISKFSIKSNLSRITFITSFVFLYYLFFRHYVAQFAYDEIIVFLLLFFLFQFYYTREKKFLIVSFSFSSLAYFYSIDIGFVINILLFANLFFLLIFSKNKIFFIVALISTLISWTIFYAFVGDQEFIKFIQNTLHLYETVTYTQGRIIPKIFTDNLTTLPLVALTFLSIYIANIFIGKSKNKFIWINLLIITLLYFISPMSTYASGHVKHASVFAMIHLYLILFVFVDNFFKNRAKDYLSYCAIVFLIGFNLYYPLSNKNIVTVKKRIENFINLDAMSFIDYFEREDLKEAIAYYRTASKNDNCIMTLNNDVIFPFLLRKQSCSEFILLFNATSKKNRLKLLKDIKKKKPNIVMVGTPERWDVIRGIPNELRHPEVFDYIYSNYHITKEINNWKFYKKN
jgi:hypothetical protein